MMEAKLVHQEGDNGDIIIHDWMDMIGGDLEKYERKKRNQRRKRAQITFLASNPNGEESHAEE
jgi:hypothetical protein